MYPLTVKPLGIPAIDDSPATHIVGSDEVGYGCMAGPLLVVSVLVPRDWPGDPQLRDSKEMSDKQREDVFTRLSSTVPYWPVWKSSEEIDERGVRNALIQAHLEAIDAASNEAILAGYDPLIIVDGNLPLKPAVSIPKADRLVPAVSMASVIAKVLRDRVMVELDAKYPEYGFAKHKGYVVPEHVQAVEKYGPCPAHRNTYAPIRRVLKECETKEPWRLLPDDDAV